MFQSPCEIFFQIGDFTIHYYGLIMALAISTGLFTTLKISKLYNYDTEIIWNISPYLILGAILGARIYYCLLDWSYYSKHLIEIFQIWHGGISIHGALLGGILSGLFYTRIKKISFLQLADKFAFGLCIGQAIGRWGNFFNSEAFGLPSNSFLKLYIPACKRPLEYMQYEYFHPTFLYESLLNILIFLILFFIIRRYTSKPGLIFFSYLIMYSVVRIFVENLRIDSVLNIYGIPVAQIMSIIIMITSIIFIFYIKKTNI